VPNCGGLRHAIVKKRLTAPFPTPSLGQQPERFWNLPLCGTPKRRPPSILQSLLLGADEVIERGLISACGTKRTSPSSMRMSAFNRNSA